MSSLKTTLKHIRRSPYQAIATIVTMLLIFLAVSIFALIVIGTSLIINHFESMPQVVAFFKDEAKQPEIEALKQTLLDSGKVSKMKFVSKSEALQTYRQQHKDNPLLLDLVTQDILPASLAISTYQLEDLDSISQNLKNSPLVETVDYPRKAVSSLIPWTNAIRIIGIVLMAVLSLVAIFVILIVIGFKISQKREEIEIMKLLGASNWYIRGPFILEGVIYGIIGTIFGWLIVPASLIYYTPHLQALFINIPLLPISPTFLLLLLGVELIIAILLSIIASSLAVLRYLK